MDRAEDVDLDLQELYRLQSSAKRVRCICSISTEILNLQKWQHQNGRRSEAQDLALDLQELHFLQSTSTRPRLLAILASEIRNLTQMQNEIVCATAEGPSYITLQSSSWKQDSNKVEIYLSLEGVDQQKIETIFKPKSYEVQLHDVQGKQYLYANPNLTYEIVPGKCKVVVKSKRVIITLFKASKETWLFLDDRESTGTDRKVGLINNMKKMVKKVTGNKQL